MRRARAFAQSNRRAHSTHEPQGPNQQINRVPEEGGLVTFDCVTDELEYPTDDEQPERPLPVEKEERQRYDDHRYADAVREPVERMLVFGFVVSQKILRHSHFPFVVSHFPFVI
jgi:hypothetical protein